METTTTARQPEEYLAKLYAQAWLDDEFRNKLETDPTAALQEFAAAQGISVEQLGALSASGGLPAVDNARFILKGRADYIAPPPACC